MRHPGPSLEDEMTKLPIAASALCVAMLAGPTAAQIETLKPLDQILSEDDRAASDPPTVQYIAVRCSSLYLALAKALDNETKPNLVAMKEDFKTISLNFLNSAANIELKHRNKGTDAYIKDLPHQLLLLTNIYTDHMTDARLRFGNLWNDPVVAADRDICQPMARK
jgi:hypothetical protein